MVSDPEGQTPTLSTKPRRRRIRSPCHGARRQKLRACEHGKRQDVGGWQESPSGRPPSQGQAARGATRCSGPGPRRSRCRRSTRCGSSTSCRRSTRLRRQPQGDRGDRQCRAMRRPSPTPSMRWSARRPPRPHLVGVLQPGRHRHQQGHPGDRAGAGAALCQARHAHLPGRDAVCPRRCPLQEAQEARAQRGADARARALSPRLREVGRGPRCRRKRSAWRRSRRACRCSAPGSARTCSPTSRRS